MLSINLSPISPSQAQLHEKIKELNNLESWNSGDISLVSDNEIQSIVKESFESLKLSPNKLLSFSLLKLADRIKLEKNIGFDLKDLACQVQNSLDSLLFPLEQDTTFEVLEKLGISELENLSQVNREGNDFIKKNLKVLITPKLQKFGYQGNNYEDGIKYLNELKGELIKFLNYVNSLKAFTSNKTPPELIQYLEEFNKTIDGDKIIPTLKEIAHMELLLNRIKKCDGKTIISNFFNYPVLYKELEKFRNFLILNCETPIMHPCQDNGDEAMALCLSIMTKNTDILKFLIKLDVPLDLKFNRNTALETAKQKNHTEMIEILTEAIEKKNNL